MNDRGLYELCKSHAFEWHEHESTRKRATEEFSSVQEEEMMGVGMDGSSAEIAVLVEAQIKARTDLSAMLEDDRSELWAKHRRQFVARIEELKSKSTKVKGDGKIHKTVMVKWNVLPMERPKERKNVADFVDDNGSVRAGMDQAKKVGRLVAGPWLGLLPTSLDLVGLGGEEASGGNKMFGNCMPVLHASSPVYVHLGSSLKVAFKIVAMVCDSKEPQNLFDDGVTFDTWVAYTTSTFSVSATPNLTAFLAPTIGEFGEDSISLALKRSPELHFPLQDNMTAARAWSVHSNLLGANVVVRGNDLKSALLAADELDGMVRVGIWKKMWGLSDLDLARRIKEALTECATRRFILGSKLVEVVILGTSSSPREDSIWLLQMQSVLFEVFE